VEISLSSGQAVKKVPNLHGKGLATASLTIGKNGAVVAIHYI